MSHIILGIDPGTIRTGFAVISMNQDQFSLLEFGVLSTITSKPLEQKLLIIGRGLENLYKKYSISDTAIEQIFVGKNPNVSFKLGQVFGLCSYKAACANSKVFSYAARYIKQAVTGSGGADKQSVKTFVLNIFEEPMDNVIDDASDALAVALCHVYESQNQISFKQAGNI